jgi:hypothetical protein
MAVGRRRHRSAELSDIGTDRPEPIVRRAIPDESVPNPVGRSLGDLAASAARTGWLLSRKRILQPHDRVGGVLRFADGSSARIYRETQMCDWVVVEPATLIVQFRLRLVRGRGHAWFRAESVLNTPLFAGFPGFVTKLWLANDANQVYRGVYEWDGLDRADAYARSLWWALALVSQRSSIRHVVVPGVGLDEVLHDPSSIGEGTSADDQWWRLVEYRAA